MEVSSILDDKYKLHILGYYIDENNQTLIDMTDLLKKAPSAELYVEMSQTGPGAKIASDSEALRNSLAEKGFTPEQISAVVDVPHEEVVAAVVVLKVKWLIL